MPTQRIEHNVYSYSQKQPRRPQSDADFPLAPESSKKRHGDVTDSSAAVRDRIQIILSDVPKRDGKTLSFQDVVDYRDTIETEWDRGIGDDLKELGVDMTASFRLMHDASSGKVRAIGDHPDKAKIDGYFESNPERADEFRIILQLGKLASVAQGKLTPKDMNQTLQIEAMAWWYQANMDTASLFQGGGVVFGAGGSAYKGLDIHV